MQEPEKKSSMISSGLAEISNSRLINLKGFGVSKTEDLTQKFSDFLFCLVSMSNLFHAATKSKEQHLQLHRGIG